MICPTCGAVVPDGTAFCTKCGCAIRTSGPRAHAAPAPGSYAQPAQAAYAPPAQPAYTPPAAGTSVSADSPFVSADEHLVATLTNGFVSNIISGEGLLREDAYVTNKRVYYNSTRGVFSKTNVRNVVDIPEVTGTKLVSQKHYGFLVMAVLCVIAGIILAIVLCQASLLLPLLGGAILFLCSFFATKKKHLRIEYAGGHIFFSVRKYSMSSVQAFQKAIYQEKDKLRS